MSAKRVCVIPGDGIGPEVVEAAGVVLAKLDLPLEYEEHPAGLACKRKHGEYLPAATLEAARASDAVLFGAITSPLASEDPHYKSVILALRNALDLYANVRPTRDYGQPCLHPGVDLLIVRENTEDLYNVPEEEIPGGVVTRRTITRRATERVSRFAFDWARARHRQRVTVVHKANVIRKGDGLFRSTFLDVAREYNWAQAGEHIVDSAAMQVVLNPKKFDVLVCPNLYGDILSDVAAGIAGGLGFAPSGSFGPRNALFEPVHGSAPDIAGKGIANPSGAILSAAMMLDHLGFPEEARRIESALRAALARGRTPDVGGSLTTRAFADLVAAAL